jgi:hypothetical protein
MRWEASMRATKKFGYLWLTLAFFLFSEIGHWTLAWFAYLNDQETHHAAVKVSEYLIETGRDTFENWQSEFLQLIWQVCGLAYFLYAGSPQSKEGDERKEEKLDFLIRKLSPENSEKILKEFDLRYPKK